MAAGGGVVITAGGAVSGGVGSNRMTTIGVAGFGTAELGRLLSARFSGAEFVVAESEQTLAQEQPAVDALIAPGVGAYGFIGAADLARMPRLGWVQCTMSGTEHWSAALVDRPEVLLTSASGIHGPAVSEMAIFHMLSLSRQARELFRSQDHRGWNRVEQHLLQGRTVGIIGLGAIGMHLAKLCKAFGMTVYGLARTRRDSAELDEFFEPGRLLEFVAQCDFVVLLVPLTEATTGLIDRSVLAAMKPTAYLLNFARGAVIDEDALIAALDGRAIAGAGLDVFVEEFPRLPETSRLWDFENVVITPHLAGSHSRYAGQIMPIIESNLEAYLAGEPDRMINLVTRQ